MGEVYRARDGRLARDVAIKVLPAAFAADGDRVARFEQGPVNPFDVSADDQRFVINSVVSATGTPSLTVVFNWPQLLKKESR